MTTTTVRYFDSTMTGAPTLNGVAGSRITLIDALIAGFNSRTLTSVTISSGIATATFTGHGFSMLGNVGTGLVQVGPVITIAGATGGDAGFINGDKRILSVPDANTFTFDVTGAADSGGVSGTITAKYAGLPMTKAHSGTNKAIYSFNGVGGTGLLFRIDDADARYPAIRGAESATDVDTYTNEIPRVASVASFTGLIGSSTADATARSWKVISDGYFLYFFSAWLAGNNRHAPYWVGDIVSHMAADDYNFAILGHENATPASLTTNKGDNNLASTANAGCYLARTYTQTGSPINHGLHGSRACSSMGSNGLVYPSNISSNVMFHYPVNVSFSGIEYRGYLPGAVQPVVSIAGSGADKDIHSTIYGNVMLIYTHTSGNTVDGLFGLIVDENWRP